MSVSYNPDYTPTGIEGGVDTNSLPWIPLDIAAGMSIKPLRASSESGMFSVVIRLESGTSLSRLAFLGAMDMMMLSGELRYEGDLLSAEVVPGVWGYIPANSRVDGLIATEAAEFLANFYGPLALLDADDQSVARLLTALDIARMAQQNGIPLVPNTLAECMEARQFEYSGPAVPLEIAGSDAKLLVTQPEGVGDMTQVHPHFVDTRAVPWLVDPNLPDIGLKVLRVSEETGTTSLIVRHNGVAGPHYHLGAADFMVLSGRIGYRAGPPEGYGPGVWFFEPAGARHDATQRIGEDEDLIYTANVYGPVQFDEGRGTPITAVQSWMQYKEAADAAGFKLVSNRFEGDGSLLAWSPIGSAN